MNEINEKEIKRRLEAISSFKTRPEVTARDLERVRRTLARQSSEQKTRPQNIWRIITNSKLTKLAAAAVIILATSLFFIQQEQPGEVQTQRVTKTEKSPAELTTLASLIFAYRQGGMERVEQICDKAIAMAGPRPTDISVYNLFEDFNGKIQKGRSYE